MEQCAAYPCPYRNRCRRGKGLSHSRSIVLWILRWVHGIVTIDADPSKVIVDFADSRVVDQSAPKRLRLWRRKRSGWKTNQLRHLSRDCHSLLTKAGHLMVIVMMIQNTKSPQIIRCAQGFWKAGTDPQKRRHLAPFLFERLFPQTPTHHRLYA